MLNVENFVLFQLPNIKIGDFIDNLVNLNVTLHPVWLAFIDMLIYDNRFLCYRFMRNDQLIKSLSVLINHQFRVTQIVLQFLEGLIGAFVTF